MQSQIDIPLNSDIITNLDSQGLLSITNEGASKLLQGQLTCDVTEVSALVTRLGAHCNPQGRIISLFRLCWYQDHYLSLMPIELIPIAISALKKYAPFFKAELHDASHLYKKIGYCGHSLDKIVPSLPTEIDAAVMINNLLIIKISDTPPRYEIIGKSEDITNLEQQLLAQAQPTSENIWKYFDILNGIPSIYPETSATFLPHDLNLPGLNGVSFKKGCYTGQEIIARMQYRGKLKNRLFIAEAETSFPLVRGGSIYRGKDPCGSIVDYCQISYNNYKLLIIAPESDVTTHALSLDPENTIHLKF